MHFLNRICYEFINNLAAISKNKFLKIKTNKIIIPPITSEAIFQIVKISQNSQISLFADVFHTSK